MDGLIVLLIIIGIISRISKGKKRQEAARKAQAKAAAFAQARSVQPTHRQARSAQPKPEQIKIPFSVEEWTALIADEKNAAEPPRKRRPLPEGASPELKSTQGESEAEHRRHVEKIAAEEKHRRERAEETHNLRTANRQKLREAMIMSEILGKPVALRPRGQR